MTVINLSYMYNSQNCREIDLKLSTLRNIILCNFYFCINNTNTVILPKHKRLYEMTKWLNLIKLTMNADPLGLGFLHPRETLSQDKNDPLQPPRLLGAPLMSPYL